MSNGNTGKMPRDWLVGIGLVIIAFGLILAGWAVFHVRSQLNQYSMDYEESSREIKAETSQKINKGCLPAQNFRAADCAAKYQEAADAKQRDQADLYAQRQMAVWAFGMGITGLVSAFLSISGIIFVWRSLEEMRHQRILTIRSLNTANKSVILAQKHSDAEFGPQLLFNNGVNGRITIADTEIGLFLTCINIGKSSAHNVKLRIQFHIRMQNVGDIVLSDRGVDSPKPLVKSNKRDLFASASFGSLSEDQAKYVFRTPSLVFVTGTLSYQSIFERICVLRFNVDVGKYQTKYRKRDEAFPRWKEAPVRVRLLDVTEATLRAQHEDLS